jgi:hypothetical protein
VDEPASLCASLLDTLVVPAAEGAETEMQALTPASETFLLGNVLFALLHEFGERVTILAFARSRMRNGTRSIGRWCSAMMS